MKKIKTQEGKALTDNNDDVQLKIQEIFNDAGYQYKSIPWGLAEEDEHLQKTLRTVHEKGISAEALYNFVNDYVEERHRYRVKRKMEKGRSVTGYKSWDEALEASEGLANSLLNTTMIWYREKVLNP